MSSKQEIHKSKPFFSIVLPTYNRAHFLSKSIESVLKQTFQNWELIIIDDGSTDKTKELVQSFSDNRIRYFWQKNQERSAARNNGISKSRGEYICFLDSDDYYLDDRLDVLYKEIRVRNSPQAMFYTGICYENNGEIVKRKETPNVYKNTLDFLVYGVIGNPQACIHAAILQKHTFNIDFSIAEDMELWLRIVAAGNAMIYIDTYNVIATHHDERSVHLGGNNPYKKLIQLYQFVFKKSHPGNAVSTPMKSFVLSNAFYGQARFFIYKNEKFRAIKSLIQSVFLFPKSDQTRHKLFLLSKLLFTKKGTCKNLIQYIG